MSADYDYAMNDKFDDMDMIYYKGIFVRRLLEIKKTVRAHGFGLFAFMGLRGVHLNQLSSPFICRSAADNANEIDKPTDTKKTHRNKDTEPQHPLCQHKTYGRQNNPVTGKEKTQPIFLCWKRPDVAARQTHE